MSFLAVDGLVKPCVSTRNGAVPYAGGGLPSDDLHVECTFRGHRSLGPPTRRERRTERNLQRCSREPQDSGGKAVSARHKAAASSSTVPDDWDEASSSEEEDNQKVWDNAYGISLSNPNRLPRADESSLM
jgi:hypothetical protein